ncbi:halocyanin domain-containing protein [Halorussus salinisoli]|uniref:halocyanin domain-containing protein n=1 Tax=Halorussus salinisoli TaxID=2558242 RepID=UPI0010C1A5BE|nr:halocyanin domain-containing protein [Halorussus salinisoli]
MSSHIGTPSDRRTFLRRSAIAVGTSTAVASVANRTSAQSEPNYDGWFDNTSNFDGTYDFTGRDEVTVRVGAEGNGGALAFSPAAIRVDPGTTVVWEWTGDGGSHNVVADDGSFESELVSEAGQTFEHTFESEGTYKYFCSPHETLGMKGAVVAGGSGGLDPSELGGGSDGGSDSGGDHAAEGGDGLPSLEAATIVTAIVMGLLSPVLFGVLLLLRGDDRDRAE